MHGNLNRRSSYIFKPQLDAGYYLKISKVRDGSVKSNDPKRNGQKRKKVSEQAGFMNDPIQSNSLNYTQVYRKRKIKLTFVMITKIPTLVYGEALD